MDTTKKQDDVVNGQQQVQGKAPEQANASSQKSQSGPKEEQQNVDAQKAEGKGQASQRGAVGEEFEADRANGKKDGQGGGKSNAPSSKDMPAAPETGKTVDKNGTKDKEAVDQYSKSNGMKKADDNTGTQPNAKGQDGKGKTSDEKAAKENASDKNGQKEGQQNTKDKPEANADKKKEGAAEEEKKDKQEQQKGDKKKDKEYAAGGEGNASAKAKKEDVAFEGGESAGSGEKKSAKGKRAKGSGGGGSVGTVKEVGGGGGGGGAISLPSIGGGGPEAPAPIGEGAGGSAIEAYANSGLSYQAENYSGLGEKVDADIDKAQTELDEKLPGEEGGEPFDAAKDAELVTKGTELQSKNDGVSGDDFNADSGADIDSIVESSALNVEAQKSAYESASEEIPDSPTVESAGSEGIDAIRAEEAAKFASAKADGPAKAAELDRTLPERE